MTRNLALAGVLFVLVMAIAGCGQRNSATVKLSEFEIKPSGVSAVAGKPFTLTLINDGRVRHNLRLESTVTDIPLPVALAPGEKATVTFIPKTAGTFTYWCGIPGHERAGMVGTLTIEAS
ncbi:MAG: cupredoxin domain-containing protein [Chloroflexi bacterium]|nr:cupredoxin domain-containing protein [Chloroflexota bacterium]